MTLDHFNPKLLNFLYSLSQLDSFVGPHRVAELIKLEGGDVSSRTIQRWFSFLHRKYPCRGTAADDSFSYFPTFYYEKLGLFYVSAVVTSADDSFVNYAPIARFRNYLVCVFDATHNSSGFYSSYLVPLKLKKEFFDAWKQAESKKLFVSYSLYPLHSGFPIYSPWHKVLDQTGKFYPEKNSLDYLQPQIIRFNRYLTNIPKTEISEAVKNNPLIVPVLFEYWYDHKSSRQVWKSIKQKLGSQTEDYLPKSANDSYAINRIQSAIRSVYAQKLTQRPRVMYLPVQFSNFFIYFYVSFKSQKELLGNLTLFAQNSLQLTVYPREGNDLFIIALIDQASLATFFDIFEKIKIERLLFVQHRRSLPYLTTQAFRFGYQDLFDPQSKSWKIS